MNMKNIIGVALNSINPDERVIRISYPKKEEDVIVEMLENIGIAIKRKSYSY